MKISKRQLVRLIKESIADISPDRNESGSVYGHGGSARMAKSQLFQIATDAAELHDILDEQDELPEWTQSKIAVMAASMDTVFDHIEYKYRSHLGGEEIDMDDFVEIQYDDEFDFTGDVETMSGADAFAVGLEAGKRDLDEEGNPLASAVKAIPAITQFSEKIGESVLVEYGQNPAPPSQSNWRAFADNFDMGVLDLDDLAYDLSFQDFYDMDISITPRRIAMKDQRAFIAALQDASSRASDMSGNEILRIATTSPGMRL